PPSFDDFLTGVRAASYDDYADREDTQVRDPRAFEEMRDHLLEMYQGAEPTGLFYLDGQLVDCITIDSQPSVRLLDLGRADRSPPDGTVEAPEEGPGEVTGERQRAESPLTLGLIDEYGNAVECEPESIPMTRITLEQLVRYETLRHFFSKGQDGRGFLPPRPRDDGEPKPEESSNARRYAYTYQAVRNFGGNSWLNLWNPSMGSDGRMSISQQWYSAGSGSGNQTLEGGWQVLPSKYNTDKAVLFIYWTADNYGSTGCYNLDCAGFVQINNNWYLGGTWSAYSTTGGTQWGFELQFKLFGDNWWMFLKGPGAYEAVGYYPDSIYGSGPMKDAAAEILYGGETATNGTWPEMGSGQFANQGWQRAAFQNTIFYIPRNENNGVGVWASLSAQEPAPSCYTVDLVPASSGGSWGTYFYFGGPGGSPC
ncbi:MAG: neprosin family prolyl endopeptidase, partial [Thermoanaerobaculia bacterium]